MGRHIMICNLQKSLDLPPLFAVHLTLPSYVERAKPKFPYYPTV